MQEYSYSPPAEITMDPGAVPLTLPAQYYKLHQQIQEACNLRSFVDARDVPVNIAIGMCITVIITKSWKVVIVYRHQ